MSTHVSNAEEDIPLESRHSPKVPDPGTEIRNNNLLPGAIVRDVKADGEHIPGMVKESTVWDVYNNEARKVDNELVKDWTASLNFLLVFAAIFAAVLTAFIIESKKMLEQDPTEILVNITIQYFNSIGSQSRNNFTRPDFEPTSAAISINCLLFASLGASLVAALASVVALQWVADYDAAITRGGSSPEDRAKRRQFRHAGIVGWKMGEIIAALPILLYSSVILFWAGAIQWMWTLHRTVGYVVAGGTTIAVLFYASTTILAAVYASAPFHTPLSRGLYWAIGPSASTIRGLVLRLPLKIIFHRVTVPLRAARISSLFQDSAVIQSIRKNFLPDRTSRHREDRAAGQDPSIVSEALAWLAQQLPISDDSHERLLLCASGILTLSTENPLSPRFHDMPWLAILEILSKRFMHQILSPTSPEKDYRGVGILLHCIDSPFIRSKVVPDASYIRDSANMFYWAQCCLATGSSLGLGMTVGTPITFSLARDVPIPSLGSNYELETTWKLIRWRNSIRVTVSGFNRELDIDDIWPEVFSDIGRYSPEFLESCLCHFQAWTNALPYRVGFRRSTYAVMFHSIVEQALHRDLTTGEALALVRAFAGYLTVSNRYLYSEAIDRRNIVPQPLLYAMTMTMKLSSDAIQGIHLAITLLVVRAAKLLVKTEQSQWTRWIALMLWISIPKPLGYLADLGRRLEIRGKEETQRVWDNITISLRGLSVGSPYVQEIARILRPRGYDEIRNLGRAAFTDPQRLMYWKVVSHCTPHRHAHYTGSQHILLYLYQGAEYSSEIYANFHTSPVRLDNIDWDIVQCNPILAMLALSDIQDLASLRFSEAVDIECAGRILEIVKTVKKQHIEFLCLLTDIIMFNNTGIPPSRLALILEVIKQAIASSDEESIALVLRPMALGLRMRRPAWLHGEQYEVIRAEWERIRGLLLAKYAAYRISSPAQLRLLSCARSAAVVRPAMGWLRMYEPL